MNTAVSRRRLMQIALAPAALAGAQVRICPRPSPESIPDRTASSYTFPTSKETPSSIPLTPDTAAEASPIPSVPVKETVWPVAGDNTANLQAAIDKVSALPLDKNGFRGAVLLKMGYYKMATPLKIQASGVVLRGEGMGDTGTVLDRHRESAPAAPRGGPRPGGQPTLVRIAGAVRCGDQGRNQADRRRRLRAGRCTQLQGGLGPGLQAGR